MGQKVTVKAIAICCLFFLGCSSYKNEVKAPQFLAEQAATTLISSPDQAAMLDKLQTLSTVTANNVFTEKAGIPEYIVGPDDILEFVFWEGTTPVPYVTRVRPDGTISYSFLDDVHVQGLTTREIDEELTGRLLNYIKNVRLDVSVQEHRSKSALLFGEINILQTGKSGPGKYNLKGKTSVLDLIVEAGGNTKDSDLKKVELVRSGNKFTLNLYDAMFKGDMTQNVILDTGDLVTVPELPEFGERVYVFGEVIDEGIYAHDTAFDLLAALGKAKGCTPTAVRNDIKIIRGYTSGKPLVLSASLDDILKRGDIAQNIALLDGDVVYVPRTVIGDVNEFILNTTPLLEYLFYPDRYHSAYGIDLP